MELRLITITRCQVHLELLQLQAEAVSLIYYNSSSINSLNVESNGKERKRSLGNQTLLHPLSQTLTSGAQFLGGNAGFADHLNNQSTSGYNLHHVSSHQLNNPSPGKASFLSPLGPNPHPKSASFLTSQPLITYDPVNNSAHHRQLVDEYHQRVNIAVDEHLKSAMHALNEKLKYYENVDQEKQSVSEQLHQNEKGREELRVTLMEAAEKVKEEQDKNFKYQEILINEN